VLALWFGLEAENGGDSCLQILVVTFWNLMAEEHVLDACYILEICKLILNLFGAHTIVSQPMHPLAEQAQVDTSCFSETGVQDHRDSPATEKKTQILSFIIDFWRTPDTTTLQHTVL
jgi:hypothetical protein